MLIQSFSYSFHKNDGSDNHVINFTDENCFLDDTGHKSLQWNNTDESLEWVLFLFSQYWNVNVENRTLCDTHSVHFSNLRTDGTNKCT